jgi:hypothetical protein
VRQPVTEEATRLVHGDRNAAYGHPLDDMGRTAGMVSHALAHKLVEPLTAEDIACVMCLVKISRQMNRPKRDNLTDLAGYAECWDWMIDERATRAAPLTLATTVPPGPVVAITPVVQPDPFEGQPGAGPDSE